MLNIKVNEKKVKEVKKPVNYYLKESTIEKLAEVAKKYNKPASTLLSEILHEVLPALEKQLEEN